MSQGGNHLAPVLESLSERVTPSAADPGYIGNVIGQYGWVLPAPGGDSPAASNQGWGAWEVNLAKPPAGGSASDPAVPVREWVFGTELPPAAVRHRLFALVDRTQLVKDGVVILTASLPGGAAQDSARPAILLQRLANPGAPESGVQGTLFISKQQARREDSGAHVLYQDIFIPGGNDSIWIDLSAPVQAADEPARYFNGFVSRFPAGGADESITVGGPQVEDAATLRRNQVTLASFDLDRA
jgi:hypothetical protein